MTKRVKLAELTPDRQNANAGTERGRAIIADSLKRYGAGRSVLVDANNELIAGNKTTAEALAQGFEAVIVDIQPNQILVARRPDLDLSSQDDTRARELAYADNFAAFHDFAVDAERLRLDAAQLDMSAWMTKGEMEKHFAKVGFTPQLQLQGPQNVAPAQVDDTDDQDDDEAAEDDEPGYQQGPAAAHSNYPRMVQLFLSGDQFDEFTAAVERLKEMHGFNNHTDAVLHAVSLAAAQ